MSAGLGPRDIVLALIFPLVMAAGFVASKTVLDVLPPILFAALRHTIAAAILIWFIPPPIGSMWRLFCITFLAATVHFYLMYAGISHLDVATAALLMQTEVPLAIVIAAIVTHRMPTRAQIVGTMLGLIGTLVVFGTPSVQENYGAAILLILASLTWAMGQSMIATLIDVKPFQLATWLAVFAMLQLWPVSIAVEGNPFNYLFQLDWRDGIALLIVGVGPTIIGFGLWCALIGRHGIVVLAPFLLTIPVFAIGLGVWLLDEQLTWMMIVGGLITLVGVALTLERVPQRKLQETFGSKDV